MNDVERRQGAVWYVPDWTKDILIPIIQEIVQPGSIIHSDKWASYRTLGQLVYIYGTVNHKENFVDPDTGVHTIAVKGFWS